MSAARPVYPLTALVGQEELKLALLLNVIAPVVGGVLVMGERGTGKSTAVRALADLLPPIEGVRGCPYNCDPDGVEAPLCESCAALLGSAGELPRTTLPVPVVDLPLGATEDRVCGTIDIGRALRSGEARFEPGLLARAHRGFLYIDEVNLLEDHLVDLLLDAAATGRHRVEREGISVEHPARFVLVGSGNPEEGELRPQLLDRFGLYVEIGTLTDLAQRVEIIKRREAYERDAAAFARAFAPAQAQLRERLLRARALLREVIVPEELLRLTAELCLRLGIDGHRGELTITRAVRALAAFEGRPEASADDVRRVADLCLRHRLRRDPLEGMEGGGGRARIARALDRLTGEAPSADDDEAPEGAEMFPQLPSYQDGFESPGGDKATDELLIAPRPARLSGELPPAPSGAKAFKESATPARRRGSPSTTGARRGRFRRASPTEPQPSAPVALVGTLRAALTARCSGERAPLMPLEAPDLRYKLFTRRAGALYIFAVDASGSMARNRIEGAKGALIGLLQESYVHRHRVALVSFRQRDAEVLLPPCQSPARACRALDALAVGGPTPLAAGLRRALEVARRARKTTPAASVTVLVFTDGRANVPLTSSTALSRAARQRLIEREIKELGHAFRREQIACVVVETGKRFTSGDEAERLAASLSARRLTLVQLEASGLRN